MQAKNKDFFTKKERILLDGRSFLFIWLYNIKVYKVYIPQAISIGQQIQSKVDNLRALSSHQGVAIR
jgi:hypothetical protein